MLTEKRCCYVEVVGCGVVVLLADVAALKSETPMAKMPTIICRRKREVRTRPPPLWGRELAIWLETILFVYFSFFSQKNLEVKMKKKTFRIIKIETKNVIISMVMISFQKVSFMFILQII